MQTIEYRTDDKSAWGRGPWDDEPDKMQWQDAATGLPCLIVRNRFGALCGYVGVAEGHPWHGKGYSDCVAPERHEAHEGGEDGWHYNCSPDGLVSVHGGLTFAAACEPDADETTDICHRPGVGEPDHVWWFGFDCSHSHDFHPAPRASGLGSNGAYRDLAYVRAECASLARQIVEAAE